VDTLALVIGGHRVRSKPKDVQMTTNRKITSALIAGLVAIGTLSASIATASAGSIPKWAQKIGGASNYTPIGGASNYNPIPTICFPPNFPDGDGGCTIFIPLKKKSAMPKWVQDIGVAQRDDKKRPSKSAQAKATPNKVQKTSPKPSQPKQKSPRQID
jgi:hypothetical protein